MYKHDIGINSGVIWHFVWQAYPGHTTLRKKQGVIFISLNIFLKKFADSKIMLTFAVLRSDFFI